MRNVDATLEAHPVDFRGGRVLGSRVTIPTYFRWAEVHSLRLPTIRRTVLTVRSIRGQDIAFVLFQRLQRHNDPKKDERGSNHSVLLVARAKRALSSLASRLVVILHLERSGTKPIAQKHFGLAREDFQLTITKRTRKEDEKQ